MFKRVRVEEHTNYTKISNQFLRDRNLSFKAKGMLTMIMSLPEDWDFTVEGFVTIVKESKNTVYGILDELKKNGYCRDYDVKNGNLKVDTNYIFYESPNEDAIQEYQRRAEEKAEKELDKARKLLQSQSQLLGLRDLESRDLCLQEENTNNNRLNKEKIQPIKERGSLSNLDFAENEKSHEQSECGRREKENLANASSAQKKERRVPSLEDARGFFRESGFRSSADKFFYFYQAKGWKGIVDWKAEANLWELRERDNQPKKEPKKDNRGEEYIQFLREQAV